MCLLHDGRELTNFPGDLLEGGPQGRRCLEWPAPFSDLVHGCVWGDTREGLPRCCRATRSITVTTIWGRLVSRHRGLRFLCTLVLFTVEADVCIV